MPKEDKTALALALCVYYKTLSYKDAMGLIKYLDSGKLFTYFKPKNATLH